MAAVGASHGVPMTGRYSFLSGETRATATPDSPTITPRPEPGTLLLLYSETERSASTKTECYKPARLVSIATAYAPTQARFALALVGVSSSSLRNWDGLIDELRLYNRALSAAEIVSLYQQDNQSFNFSLANSMSLSATQGSSATNTITASLVSGSPQPVSFSISGLPSGASGSFSQTTCTATCSSLLTIATAASTPTGTYTITVTGTGGDVTKTTSFTLTVNSSTGTLPTTTYTLNATPSTVQTGGTITVSWTAPPGSSSKDWISLYASGAANTNYISWQYTNGATSGSLTMPAPSNTRHI